MTTKNFVVKNGLQVGNVVITAANSFISAANANLGNLVVANFFSGDGGLLSNIAGANITGNITGNVSNANFASYAGDVVNSAQPNITSVGNLTSLTVTGNISTGGILTDGYYYANGAAVDFQQPGGSNTQVQFNDDGDLGGSANFTFNKSTNVLTVSGNGAFTNLNAGNLLTANFVAGTLTTNAQPNITSVGSLTDLTVTGNAAAGNVNAGNLLTASFVAGTLTTAAQPNITSVGNLSALEVTGNVLTSANIVTDLIVGRTSGVSITATGANQNILLAPTGTGIVDVSGKKLGNLATPTADTDAATKLYVDEVAQGLDPKASVEYATAAALPAYTYNNGTSGVGATITANANGAFSIDGSTPSANARVLIKNETASDQPYNGIYVVTTVGDGSTPFVLTRSTDFDGAPGSEIPGAFVFVEAGSTNADTGWVCTTDNPVTVGTTNITFTQFSGAGTFTAGTGLTLTGTVFSISNTTVTGGSYGNGDYVATFTVNGQGQLTAAANTAITANAANLTGTTLNSSIVTSSLTSVGTLGNLTVSGNAAVGGLLTDNFYYANGTPYVFANAGGSNTQIQFNDAGSFGGSANFTFDKSTNVLTLAGNLSATNANLGNLAEANFFTGTLTTNAQPNITSVGTLTSLSVTGNITAGNVSATDVSGTTLGGTLTTAAQPNITSVGTLTSLAVTGNVSAGNVSATDVSGTTLGGTLTTAAQPNITSVGSLTSLTVTGNASAGNLSTGGALSVTGNASAGNLSTGGALSVTGNVSAGNISTGGELSVTGNANVGNIGATGVVATTLAGSLTTASQPNVTSLGTLTSLTVSGNVSAGVVKLTTGLSSNRSNVSVSTGTVIDEFDPAIFRTAKYVVSASGDDGYQSVEALLVHDGTDSYITIYGSVCSNVSADIVELSSNINGVSGNVSVYASSNSANAIVNVVASYILT